MNEIAVTSIDHVLIAVGDPVVATGLLGERHGWGVVPGPQLYAGLGSHLVPLTPPQYLRLVYAADPDLLGASAWGGWMSDLAPDEMRLIGWGIKVSDLDAAASRLGRPAIPQVIVFENGQALSWRAVADTQTFASMPYFVDYDLPAEQRLAYWSDLYLRAGHETPPGSVRWVEINAEPERTRWWFGGDPPWLRVGHGPPGLVAVGLGSGLPGAPEDVLRGQPFQIPSQ
jgi:glyoxalase-like protein